MNTRKDQTGRLYKVLDTFKSLEEVLELGRTTPAIVAKLVSINYFINNSNILEKLSPEQMDQLQSIQADRITLVIAKDHCLKLIKSVINQIYSTLSEIRKSKNDVWQPSMEIKSILDFFNQYDQTTSEPIVTQTDPPIEEKSEKVEKTESKVQRILEEIKEKKNISELEIVQIAFMLCTDKSNIFDLAHKDVGEEEIDYVLNVLTNHKVNVLLLPISLTAQEAAIKARHPVGHIKFFDLESINRNKDTIK
ncbi:MAG: hypothetical protein IEMM0008_0170 [bacterium]|nr:MAG: hypothetical protein IEMM0008_0170 [bacterium]